MQDEPEIAAMSQIGEAIKSLDEPARHRVLSWAWSRYVGGAPALRSNVEQPSRPAEPPVEVASMDAAELYHALTPSTDAERALAIAYWLQDSQEQKDFEAQQINSELKNLGHGVSNITVALSRLINQKPQLVIQTKKSGSSKQARKTYRLTSAGLDWVRNRLGSECD